MCSLLTIPLGVLTTCNIIDENTEDYDDRKIYLFNKGDRSQDLVNYSVWNLYLE